jgi:hypothetical protein
MQARCRLGFERRVDAVDTEAIGQKVKQEFAAKDRVRKEVKPVPTSKKSGLVSTLPRGGEPAASSRVRSKVAQDDTASVSPCLHAVYWLSFFCSSATNPFWNTGSNSWA